MSNNQTIHVLLVEDEAGDAQLVQIELRQAQTNTINVVWVKSLSEADCHLQTASVDVLLLDLSLPDSDGLETIKKARAVVGEIPIIALTGRSDTDFALQALEAGISDYVVKGNYGNEGLARVIRYALFRAEMEAKNNLLVAALEAAANGIMITDTNANITWVNSAFTHLTGYSAEEAIGRKPKDLIKSNKQNKSVYQAMWRNILQGKHWRGELINKRKNGSLYHEELSIAPVKDRYGNITHFIGIKEDISHRKQLEARLQKLANTDPLTELYNRRAFLVQLSQEVAKLSRDKNLSSALLMVDLDYFKRINDTFGHSTGDEVLRKFAEIVHQITRVTDFSARLGGEEFAILLPNATKKEAMAMAERLRQQVASTVIFHKKGDVYITISIGAAALSSDDIGGDAVLHHADTALYAAKTAGRNQSRWFNTSG